MKKTLALVLALAMVFSTITVAFAEGTLGQDAQICADLGMLKGETGTVDAAYVATAPTRLQAAVMLLRLKGLEAEALAFTGEDNFADGNIAWAEGANLLAYLKANPQLGWAGDGTNFNPSAPITAKEYYKVLLESLGYKQTTAEVVGDFTWENVVEFAATVGLSKVATVTNYTVNDLAIATVEALKLNVKDTEKTLVATLVEAGKVSEAAAVAAGLMTGAPVAGDLSTPVDEVTALGNTVVEVVFEADVDAAAAGNVANYTIEGLAINEVVVTGTDSVRLMTAAQTAGKVYALTVNGVATKFSGCPKVSGAPAIEDVTSTDVEEVEVVFNKNVDFATASDVANYTISGVEIVSADVDGDTVTLTTVGVVARKQYTIKVKNIKSVDGALLRSASDNFYSKLDTTAPKIESVEVETNQRVIVTFDEEVSQETAENIANYTIKTYTGDVALEVLSVVWDSDDEDNVEITTAVQTANKKYEIAILGVADQTKAANTITKAQKDTFYGKKEDTKEPTMTAAAAMGRNLIMVTYTDDSKIDPATALDPNSYTLEKASTDYSVESVVEYDSENGMFMALLTVEDMPTGSYTLTAEGIADEFGNEIDSADKNFAVSLATYAASTIDAIDFVDDSTPAVATGNHLTLTFSKALDEASAEDIANYSLDGDIGAPIEATYDKDTYKVTLKTNDLVDNYLYELVVDGVTDLAGNVLDLTISDISGTGWDEEAPELESAYSVNKYVVALGFDEEVTFAPGTTITLRDEDEVADDVVLEAKALKDDDTVIEFSDYAGEALLDDVTYFVYEISAGITDVSEVNDFVAPEDLNEYLVQGTDEDPEQVAVETIEQVDGRTFAVTFDANVLVDEDNIPSGYIVEDADGDEVLKLIRTSNISESVNSYAIDLSSFITDEHGIDVADENDEEIANDTRTTDLYVEYADDDAPYIVSVTAVDRFTLKVEYSENIWEADAATRYANTFSIKNSDDEISKSEMFASIANDTTDDTKLTITLSKPLESIYEYDLKILNRNVIDVAQNQAEEAVNDVFTFDGTDLADSQLNN